MSEQTPYARTQGNKRIHRATCGHVSGRPRLTMDELLASLPSHHIPMCCNANPGGWLNRSGRAEDGAR